MNAVGYIRVSTEDQAQNGVSLEMQTTKIRQYCDLHDINLVGIYGDPGISAKNTEKRPGVTAVMHLVGKKRVDAVIIYKLDRLVRSTVDALDIAQRMDKCGVGLHSITEKFDTRSAVGELIFTLMAALAQMERKLIGERTAAALQSMKANGQRVSRHAPIGWRFVDGVVVQDLKEQAAILYAKALHEDNGKWSLSQISTKLYLAGFKARSGRAYSKSTIQKMIGGECD